MASIDATAGQSTSAERPWWSNPRYFIVAPLYDWVFFITAPLLALGLGIYLAGTPLNADHVIFDLEKSFVDFGIGVFIFAHLIIVIFRSHLNPKVFNLHPARFTLVPILLFLSIGLSTWVLVICSVLATFWDVYHSGMQTFGLSRIYDARAGNPPQAGRRLDWILNLVLYAGPIAAGATLMDHVEDFYEFREVGSAFFVSIPSTVDSNARYISWFVIVAGTAFVLFYLFAYWRMARQGYRISPQKIVLLASTAACSIYAWGFNPFGMAFFIMNFFHALQYFAIVWWAEKGNIGRILGLEGGAWAKPAALLVLVCVGVAYGVFSEVTDVDDSTWLFSLFLVISLMHFWYDSFIWSVARKQV